MKKYKKEPEDYKEGLTPRESLLIPTLARQDGIITLCQEYRVPYARPLYTIKAR